MGMIEGALIALAAFLLGRLLPGRKRKDLAGGKSPKPVCGCGHHHAYHDPKTGACGHAKRLVTYSDAWRTTYGDTAKCPCRQYSGPVPLPEVYAPEISS